LFIAVSIHLKMKPFTRIPVLVYSSRLLAVPVY
jgi:hypothetical protein